MQPLNLTRSVFFYTVLDQDLRQVSFFHFGREGYASFDLSRPGVHEPNQNR